MKDNSSLFNIGGVVAKKEELKPIKEYKIENYKEVF